MSKDALKIIVLSLVGVYVAASVCGMLAALVGPWVLTTVPGFRSLLSPRLWCGETSSAAEIPQVGFAFSDLETQGELHYAVRVSHRGESIASVWGKTMEDQMNVFCKLHHLDFCLSECWGSNMSELSLSRVFRECNVPDLRTEFTTDDARIEGKVEAGGRSANVLMIFRRSDGMFLCLLEGMQAQ